MNINWKKNTALFLTGQALSQFGSMIVQFAIMWHITLKSLSGSMMTLFVLVGILPMFFISPIAGVWADRYNKKHLINIADGTVAFFSLLAAVLLYLGYESYTLLLLCAFARSLGMGVQEPAVNSFIPEIVPVEHLTKINGFKGIINSLVAVTCPMIAGALMTFTPLGTLFLMDVVTASIGIFIVYFFVKVPQKVLTSSEFSETQPILPQKSSYIGELMEGLRYIRLQGYILRIIILTAIFIFMIAPAAYLTPLQVARNFGNDVWRLSTIEIAFSGGALLGSLLIAFWGGFKNRIYTIALSVAVNGIFIMGLGITNSFLLYTILMALAGVFIPLFQTPSMVILQTKVQPEYMGRVMAVYTMNGSFMMPIGMLVFGPLSDIISLDTIMIFTGAVITILLIPMVSSKVLRQAGEL